MQATGRYTAEARDVMAEAWRAWPGKEVGAKEDGSEVLVVGAKSAPLSDWALGDLFELACSDLASGTDKYSMIHGYLFGAWADSEVRPNRVDDNQFNARINLVNEHDAKQRNDCSMNSCALDEVQSWQVDESLRTYK